MARETLVIVNPASAGGSTAGRWAGIARQIESVLGPVEVEWTTAPGDAARLARAGAARGVERIVVAGGDGTVGEVATGLLGEAREGEAQGANTAVTRPRIGLLPLGSGQDLARSLGLPRSLESALALIAAGDTRTLDAGRVEYRDRAGILCARHFLNEASAGLSAATVRNVGRLSKRMGPRLGFAAGAVTAILSQRPRQMSVEVDGEPIHQGSVSLVVAANGRYFGAGMQVAPLARLDDGYLEVVLVRGLATPRLLVNLPSIFSGRHLDHPAVSRHAVRALRVEPLQGTSPIEADGESLGVLPLRAKVRPAALRVFAPAQAERGEDCAGVAS